MLKKLFLCSMKYRIIIILFFSFSLIKCAKVGRPTGGDKDEKPPISIEAKPDFGSLNFKNKKIKIYFDEYIKLKDLNKQLIVSPPLKYPPIITPLGTASKYISIEIKDTLKENTTYSFSFGNAIQDNSEGNPLKQFKYIFSTGDYLDSLSVSGTVKDAFNMEALTEISVLLYKVDEKYTDSLIYNKKPNYITNTLDIDSFSISNIKAGKYLLVALKDISGNLMYDNKEDLIGFLDEPINIPTDTTFNLHLYKEENLFSIKKLTEVSSNHFLIPFEGEFKTSISNVLDKKLTPIQYHTYKDKKTDSIHIWHKAIDTDTLFVAIKTKDSITKYPIRLRSKEKDSIFISNKITKTLHLKDSLFLFSKTPITKIDKSKIGLIDKDSLQVPFDATISNSKMEILIDFDKKQKENYSLQILPEAFEDYFEQKNDTIKFSFNTKSEENYGEIIIDLINNSSLPIIIELLDKKYEVISTSYSSTSRKSHFPLLSPDKYTIRVIIDANSNNKWDAGSFLLNKQPERVIYLGKTIELRANWSVTEKMMLD